MAILPIENNVYWKNVWNAIRTEAEDSSFMLSEYEVSDIKDAEWTLDIAEQTRADGILLCPKGTLTDQFYEHLTRLKQQGVKIVILDTNISAAYCHAFVGIDNKAAGATAAQYLCPLLTDSQTVLQIHSNLTAHPSTTLDRINGFYSVMEQNHFTSLIHDLITTSDTSTRISDIRNVLLNYDLPLFLVGFSPGYTLKAAFTVSALDLSDQIHVVGFAESPEALQYVEDGVIQALFVQDNNQLGKKSVRIMQQLLCGESVAAEHYIDFTVVTSENVSDYISNTP